MPRKPYKSDLTDAEWAIIEPLIPPAKKGGHPRTVDMREIINGMFYVLKTGCSWEMLPHDLPPSSTVYFYFRLFQKKGRWQKINRQLRQRLRKGFGRDAKPTAVSVDSQSVKTTVKSAPPALRFPQRKDGASRGKYMALTEEKRSKEENVTF